MDVAIRSVGTANAEMAADIQKLADSLAEDIAISIETADPLDSIHAKDGALITGIAIASLAVGAIGTLFTVLSYWATAHPQYRVVARFGNTDVQIASSSKEDLVEIINRVIVSSAKYLAVTITEDE